MIYRQLFGYQALRKKQLNKAQHQVLKNYLAIPLPDKNTPIKDVPLLTLDFETTGLDAKQDKLLSVGYCEVNQLKITLATSHHQIINCQQALASENVGIHHITDQEQARGEQLKHEIDRLLQLASGKVLLVHYAKVERTFLQQACLELYGQAPLFLFVDTLALHKKCFDQKIIPYDPSQLRLSALRDRYKLHNYHAHNALSDAVATAELFQAYVYQNDLQDKPLKQFLSW
ncbi:DNA polymerase III subunit epsilon [Thalassotalea sp. LPB0316]|uniref:exonuclease domain-containing protein n=1 Tax=Thalassotalea sp. LPB0316 TaxID=2769490 RepID=UPI001866EFCE|nr:exonuclease domain-containing protein [Thalassotalea sp. LPB0316]QOL25106.1 DNA polymerase III subunit epsilon [Thalassotalea sp. LPB0316]